MNLISIPRRIFSNIKKKNQFFKDFRQFKENSDNRFRLEWSDRYPCLDDKTSITGFDKHYTYHTAWAARKLKSINPNEHIDISSMIYFSTLVSAFIPIKFYDYRPAQIDLQNLECKNADLLKLPFETNSVESISCMHVVEHVGLGRYGDPIDIKGDLKAIEEIKRVTKVNGHVLFVVPLGKAKIMFNAHRIYSFSQITSYFKGFELKEFALIPDQSNEGIIFQASEEQTDMQEYGCGCFWFVKK